MAVVTTQRVVQTVPDPEERAIDPWAAFRLVEILDLNWSQSYRHSLGKYSRFFVELENHRFLATRCPICGKVWSPPRPVCPAELAITEWVELSGRGVLVSWSVLHVAPSMATHVEPPYVLAYVAMEGADTLFTHILTDVGTLDALHHGMPVQVVYTDGPVDHPILLMAFQPVGINN